MIHRWKSPLFAAAPHRMDTRSQRTLLHHTASALSKGEFSMLRHPCKLLSVLTVLTLLALSCISKAQNLVVCEYFNARAFKFGPDGTNLGLFASSSATARFYDMAFDANGYLYVSGALSGNIRRFSPTGVDLGDFVTVDSPAGIAFDRNGNLYVTSYNNNTVHRFSSTGTDLGVFATLTGYGAAANMIFDTAGNLYITSYLTVSDTSPGSIRRFSPTGQDLGVFAPVSAFTEPAGLAFDSAGNLYVSDRGSNVIHRFSPTGANQGNFATTGMNVPTYITFDANGNLYASNYGGTTVRRFIFSPRWVTAKPTSRGCGRP